MPGTLLALILATSALVLIPGPNVALIVATSLRHGLRLGLITAAGTTIGIALQLLTVIVSAFEADPNLPPALIVAPVA